MTKWFFRFLKAGFITLAFLALGVVSLLRWAQPNPRELALVPIALDAVQLKGAGLIANATKEPWVVFIVGTNRTTSKIEMTRIWVTADSLQAVSYTAPIMAPEDTIEFRIFYAKKMVLPKHIAPRV